MKKYTIWWEVSKDNLRPAPKVSDSKIISKEYLRLKGFFVREIRAESIEAVRQLFTRHWQEWQAYSE